MLSATLPACLFTVRVRSEVHSVALEIVAPRKPTLTFTLALRSTWARPCCGLNTPLSLKSVTTQPLARAIDHVFDVALDLNRRCVRSEMQPASARRKVSGVRPHPVDRARRQRLLDRDQLCSRSRADLQWARQSGPRRLLPRRDRSEIFVHLNPVSGSFGDEHFALCASAVTPVNRTPSRSAGRPLT